MNSLKRPRCNNRTAFHKTITTLSFLLLTVFGDILKSEELPGSGFPELTQVTRMEGNERRISFSHDGRAMVFQSDINGRNDIYLVSITGGEPKRLTENGGENTRPTWSPDGKWIAYESGDGGQKSIMIISTEGENEKMVSPPGQNAWRPYWSPNSKMLAFQTKVGEHDGIWMTSLNGKPPRQITDGPGNKICFGWSPDGQYIGYYVRGTTNENLFAISIADGNIIQITNHPDHEWQPRWSPDGRRVLFYSTWENEMTEVWITDIATSALTRISNHHDEDFAPQWSPDGTQVLFISRRGGKGDDFYLTAADGGTPIPIGLRDRIPTSWPTWSPDGRYVVFSTNVEKDHLYSLRLSDGSIRQISDAATEDFRPAYSPDGRLIAFQSTRFGSEGDVLIMDAKNGGVRPLTQDYQYHSRPRWSADGEYLLTVSSPGGSVRTNNIYLYSAHGDLQKQVTKLGGVRNAIWAANDASFIFAYDSSANYTYNIWKIPAAGGEQQPLVLNAATNQPTDYSPDGSEFLFTSNLSGKNRIYRMPVSGGEYSEIKNDIGGGEGARFSPDGRRIAFLSRNNPENFPDIYLMPAGGGTAARLTKSRAEESWPDWAPDGKSIIFSANIGDLDIWKVDVSSFLTDND